jgi:hypothetical protein
VRELMEKGESRRDHGGRGTITFPASGWAIKNRQKS